MLIIKINNFRGDLNDISAKTATLVVRCPMMSGNRLKPKTTQGQIQSSLASQVANAILQPYKVITVGRIQRLQGSQLPDAVWQPYQATSPYNKSDSAFAGQSAARCCLASQQGPEQISDAGFAKQSAA